MKLQEKPAGLLLKQARMLIPRLERLSPDSSWAHRASGCRGTLLRLAQRLEAGTLRQKTGLDESVTLTRDLAALEQALDQGFQILRDAARERFK